MAADRIRRVVLIVALLNLAYFFVEFIVAASIGSAALFADSADFLEDTAINLLVFFAVAWSAPRRRTVGGVLALLILIPAVAALGVVIYKLINPVAPPPEGLTLTAAGALIVNVVCAIILLRVRDTGSGLLTFVWSTAWFDIIAGAVIAAVNFSAFKEVWEESREEHDSVEDAFAEMDDD